MMEGSDWIMKRILLLILCLCLLVGSAASEEEISPMSLQMKIWNQTDQEITYLRFVFYNFLDPLGCLISCPDSNEGFYRCFFIANSWSEVFGFDVECFCGFSDLPPKEAILQAMNGIPAEEHPVRIREITLSCGNSYALNLIRSGEEYRLVYRNPDPKEAILQRLTDFSYCWSKSDFEAMLDMCTADWKTKAENPLEELIAALDKIIPISLTPEEFSGEDEDLIRTVTVRISGYRDAGIFQNYSFRIMMQKEEDGIWYINPGSLMEYEVIPDD